VSLGANRPIPRHVGAQFLLHIVLSLPICVSSGLAQNPSHPLPKYDIQTETKTKGIVDEVKVFDLGTRKDFVQLIVKSGEDKVVVFVCPKSFQDELGFTLSKGDEVTVTGSKVKQDTSDVILARELARGTETLLFRDAKGNPVWDWRTGK